MSEEQPRFEGWLPASGHVETRCRTTLSPRSLAALCLAGFEDDEAQDFDAPRLPIDPAAFHTHAVDWDRDEAVFTVDGDEVRRCPSPPTYPLHLVPELVVDHIAGYAATRSGTSSSGW